MSAAFEPVWRRPAGQIVEVDDGEEPDPVGTQIGGGGPEVGDGAAAHVGTQKKPAPKRSRPHQLKIWADDELIDLLGDARVRMAERLCRARALGEEPCLVAAALSHYDVLRVLAETYLALEEDDDAAPGAAE
jgi:hypothetical protein